MKKIISDIMIATKIAVKKIPNKKQKENILRNQSSLKKDPRKKFLFYLLATLCVIALFFSISMIFTSVTVIVRPRIQSITFSNESFTTKLKTASAQDFPFEVISINKEIYKTVDSTGEKYAEIRASGKITIYNAYGVSEQKLISGTRFSLTDGRIYRLTEPITVPGLKKINNKNIPGSIIANIIADQVGAKYNLKTSDLKENFKIPGFKDTIKYNDFYATLAEDITGGFIGQKKTITSEKEQELILEMHDDLQKLIISGLKTKILESYLSFDNLNNIEYGPLTQENDDLKVKVGMKASLNAIVFNRKKMASYLAVKKLPDFNKLPVDIIIPDDFILKIISTSTTPWLEKDLEISLTGTAEIKWIFNPDTIKAELVGKKITELAKIKTKYQDSISDLEPHFKPFWQIFFPDDISKIEVME